MTPPHTATLNVNHFSPTVADGASLPPTSSPRPAVVSVIRSRGAFKAQPSMYRVKQQTAGESPFNHYSGSKIQQHSTVDEDTKKGILQ